MPPRCSRARPVDILVNNAGRRSAARENSYDCFDDYSQRSIGLLRVAEVILDLLPSMASVEWQEGGRPHHQRQLDRRPEGMPRFSAYVVQVRARRLSSCASTEVIDDGVNITTIDMPLVRTPMIAPTKTYDAFRRSLRKRRRT